MHEFGLLLHEAAGRPPGPLDMVAVRHRAARLSLRRRVMIGLGGLGAVVGLGTPIGVSLAPTSSPSHVETGAGDRRPSVEVDAATSRRSGGGLETGGATSMRAVAGVSVTGATRRAAGDVSEQTPSLDGERIAFTLCRREAQFCDGAIYVADGAAPAGRLVAEHAHSPAWSPDGRRLAYVTLTDEGSFKRGQLAVMDADGSHSRVIRRTRDQQDVPNGYSVDMPTWSPDGTAIAFVLRDCGQLWGGKSAWEDDRYCRPGSLGYDPPHAVPWSEIRSIRPDGGGERVLVTGRDAFHDSPQWSPDGRKLAFARATLGGSWDVYVADADGANATNVSGAALPGLEAADPSWSPDGRWIAITAFPPTGCGGSGIWLLSADGSSTARVTTGCDGEPSWTADGSQLVFTRYSGRYDDPGTLFVKRITAVSGGEAAGPITQWVTGAQATVLRRR